MLDWIFIATVKYFKDPCFWYARWRFGKDEWVGGKTRDEAIYNLKKAAP